MHTRKSCFSRKCVACFVSTGPFLLETFPACTSRGRSGARAVIFLSVKGSLQVIISLALDRYSTRQGNIEHREYVAIVSEGSGISSQRGGKRKVGSKGPGAQQSKRGQKGGAAFGRYKGPSAGAMAHILFRSSKGGVEGRLPREVGPRLS